MTLFISKEELNPMAEGIFTGRTALVTGGGRGIGRAICLMLAENWARVAINCQNNSEAARETLTLVEGRAPRR